MPPDDIARFRHMLEAGEAACRFITGCHRGELAVEIIGEAVSKIHPETRTAVNSRRLQ
jgi:uncharacterized protein with HEPN domain